MGLQLQELQEDLAALASSSASTSLTEEKTPELCRMAIEAGLMIAGQPLEAIRRDPETAVRDQQTGPQESPAHQTDSGASVNGRYASLMPAPVAETVEKINTRARRLNAKNRKTGSALKKNAAPENRSVPPLAAMLRKKTQTKKNEKLFSAGEGEDDDENVLESGAFAIVLREMQLQKEALEAACQAVAAVQSLEADYLATPEEQRTQAQYDALVAAYENARVQVALEGHHAGLARTAMSQAQSLSVNARVPAPAMPAALQAQTGLDGVETKLTLPSALPQPEPKRDDPAPVPPLLTETPQ